jgi:NADH-quinone oxidoreductase subunit L
MSETALAFVLFIGATTAFFTGLIGIVQNDIKRVVAYSTLSQLGYMTVALGVSAYAGAVYHLMTHAFFKALLFLAAGSVIIGMHHEQDMRRMGGLRKYMPITYWTSLVGTLALVGFPFFSGYYSKDSIIEAAKVAAGQGGWVQAYAYIAVLLGVFVTAFYSFRLLYLTFHGEERFREAPAGAHGHDGGHHDVHAGAAQSKVEAGHGAHDVHGSHDPHHDDHGHHGPVTPHESPWVVTLPLILLAIPSIAIGFLTVGPMLFGGWFGESIVVRAAHDTLAEVGRLIYGGSPVAMGLHFYMSPVFWLAFAGFALATYLYLFNPALAGRMRGWFAVPYRILERKYGFDELYQAVFARGSLRLGRAFWRGGDAAIIDGVLVDGTATLIDRVSAVVRNLQTGYLYHYAFAMIVGLIVLLGALILSLR